MTKRRGAPKLPPHMPPIPDGFTYSEVFPSYHSDELGLSIRIDHIDPAHREFEKRFVVQHVVRDTVMTDDWKVFCE